METRLHFTHVALICNDRAIQPLVPQVIFVAASTLKRADWEALQAELPDNVYVKRLPKGWNCSAQHQIIVRILGLILPPFLNEFQPILAFDAAPLHLAAEVLSEIINASMWYVVLPAKTTSLLQPLDTHVFFRYKLFLKARFAELMEDGAAGKRTMQMIRIVVEAIRRVLQARSWQTAF